MFGEQFVNDVVFLLIFLHSAVIHLTHCALVNMCIRNNLFEFSRDFEVVVGRRRHYTGGRRKEVSKK